MAETCDKHTHIHSPVHGPDAMHTAYSTGTHRTLAQTLSLEQVDTFPYLGSLITEDGDCTTEFRTRLNRRHAGDRGITAENMEK